jgi:hypothetical protein
MKKINLIFKTLICILFITSCSSDDSENSNVTNGFKANGTFHATDIGIAGNGFPYFLRFSNTTETTGEDIQSGVFFLMAQSADTPLTVGTYSTANGPEGMYGIYGYNPIQFVDTSAENSNIRTSAYWHNDNEFISGNVTINSISLSDIEPTDQITEIDIDYVFKWQGMTIVGNYSGEVVPEY